MFNGGNRTGKKKGQSGGGYDNLPPRVQQTFFSSVEAAKIPELKVLDAIVDVAQSKEINFEHTVFVGVQHILDTTATLFQALIKLGAKPNQMYFSGKCYSTCLSVAKTINGLGIFLVNGDLPKKPGQYLHAARESVREIWARVVEDLQKKHKDVDTIIILDEGGHCLEEIPYSVRFNYKIAGIEQTRNGLYSKVLELLPYPVVSVASSAAKCILESPLIANAVVAQIENFLASNKIQSGTIFGVIGNGAIGQEIALHLLRKGMTVLVYDEDEEAFSKLKGQTNCVRLTSAPAVIANAQYILGCTGQDITSEEVVGDILGIIRQNKVFISCSSEDKEFLTLLRIISSSSYVQDHPLWPIDYEFEPGIKIQIIRGGFPVNFDREPENILPQKIQLTRGLLLGACIQAKLRAKKLVKDGITVNEGVQLTLDANVQHFVVKLWHQLGNQVKEGELKNFDSVSWIAKNSGGQTEFIQQLNDFGVAKLVELTISESQTDSKDKTKGTDSGTNESSDLKFKK